MKGERKMKIKKICIMALIIVLISSFATRCFAVTEATEATNNSKITKEQLNEKFQEFRRKAPNVEHNKLVIMVALELMQEVLGMNKSLQEYAQCERLLATMLEDVEKAG